MDKRGLRVRGAVKNSIHGKFVLRFSMFARYRRKSRKIVNLGRKVVAKVVRKSTVLQVVAGCSFLTAKQQRRSTAGRKRVCNFTDERAATYVFRLQGDAAAWTYTFHSTMILLGRIAPKYVFPGTPWSHFYGESKDDSFECSLRFYCHWRSCSSTGNLFIFFSVYNRVAE